MRTYVLGEMYTRKGNDQQASHRLCYLSPIHPILSSLFIFIHIIDCGYSLEPFNYSHELQLIKRLILDFLCQLSIGRNLGRGEDILSVPLPAFELDIDLKNLVHMFLLEHAEWFI